jgi:hypothetical protein
VFATYQGLDFEAALLSYDTDFDLVPGITRPEP